jgi:murein DD-endopeptidase MepM/ murein hydrolase activator NlpD
MLLAACSTRDDLTYTVRPGDTLHGIGLRYELPYEEIARVNGIEDPRRLRPGQVLRIPAGAAVRRAPAPPVVDVPAGVMLWPVAGGRLSSPYGPRDASFHEGVDITAPIGTPVLAAERGIVVYSGYRSGYGNVVVVRHDPALSTLYGHNQSNRVRVGQPVRRGEVIALVGDSGRTTGANLHFEVWRGDRVVDPMAYFRRRDPVVAEASAVVESP